MGTGHVMRCMALARAAQRAGLEVRLLCRAGVDWVRERLESAGLPVELLPDAPPGAEAPQALLRQLQDSLPRACPENRVWVALDGYHFTAACHDAVMAAGYRLLVVDDYAHCARYHCDILLNQNIGAEALVYHGSIGDRLLGPRYALLRPEFAAARLRALQRDRSEAATLLLTLGGGDFSGHLGRLAPALTMPELAGRRLRVLAGAMPPERVAALLRDCPARVEVLGRVDDMPALLLDTDLCITAGGSTCWELCCLGVPFLTLEVAENQRNICAWLSEHDIAPAFSAEALGRLLTSAKLRGAHAARVRALTDGTGADAVVKALLERA